MRATENLYTDPGSIFLEYAWSDNHFAISLQKTTVFDEKQHFLILDKFQKSDLQNFQKKTHKKKLSPIFSKNTKLND